MKVFTVHQPWATLIVTGIRNVEDRSWRTDYRGRLGIHAGLYPDQDALDAYGHLLDEDPPLGALIGSVTLVDCIKDSNKWSSPGPWHWILADPEKLAHPRQMPGQPGLWETPCECDLERRTETTHGCERSIHST